MYKTHNIYIYTVYSTYRERERERERERKEEERDL